MLGEPTFSPDGEWMWDGAEWIPAPPTQPPPINTQPPPRNAQPPPRNTQPPGGNERVRSNKRVRSKKFPIVALLTIIISAILVVGAIIDFAGIFEDDSVEEYSQRISVDYSQYSDFAFGCDEEICNAVVYVDYINPGDGSGRVNIYVLSPANFLSFKNCEAFEKSEFTSPAYGKGGWTLHEGFSLSEGDYFFVFDNGFRSNQCGDEVDTDGNKWTGDFKAWITFECYRYDISEGENRQEC